MDLRASKRGRVCVYSLGSQSNCILVGGKIGKCVLLINRLIAINGSSALVLMGALPAVRFESVIDALERVGRVSVQVRYAELKLD